MIGDFIAGLIGKRIDERDGEGGAVGAAVGVLAYEAGKRIIPAVLILGAAAIGARYIARKINEG